MSEVTRPLLRTVSDRHFPSDKTPKLRYVVDESTGCWLWMGALNDAGYGILGTNRTGTYRAHRVSYELEHGPLPADKQLDHKCRIRRCINPAHLEPVTNQENAQAGAKAKLTPAMVLAIRARKGQSTYRSLAAEYGVSSCAISNVMNGKRWANVAADRTRQGRLEAIA